MTAPRDPSQAKERTQMAQAQTVDDAPQSAAEAHAISDMYLIFLVGEEEYGVGIDYVTEIVGLQKIMSVPDVPSFIKGVINLRGNVIPVMDVRLRFGLPARDYDTRTVIIVLEVGEAPIGLVVDAVRDVREIAPDCIDPAPKTRRATGGLPVTRGIGRPHARRDDDTQTEPVTVILDVENMMRSDADTLERAGGAAPAADPAAAPSADADADPPAEPAPAGH